MHARIYVMGNMPKRLLPGSHLMVTGQPALLELTVRGFCSVFERGAAIVGRDAAAHGFWDKYLRFAGAIKEPFRAASIYRRALAQPLKQLDKYMSGCDLRRDSC